MGNTLNIVPFFMYLTIAPLILLSLQGFIFSATPMVYYALGFHSSCTGKTSPS